MTKTLGERMTKLETDINYIKEKIEDQCQRLDDFIKSADNKYANKLTEKLVYGLCGLVLLSFLSLLIYKIGWA